MMKSVENIFIKGIFENNLTDFQETVIFEIVQEYRLKYSKLIHFYATKN